MASLFGRMRAWTASQRASEGNDPGWVQPGNDITRAILGAGRPVPEYTAPAPVPPAVQIPAQTLAEIEAAAAAEEAAASAFEAARRAALGIPPAEGAGLSAADEAREATPAAAEAAPTAPGKDAEAA